jgi:diguanylate cyclase (GGDEF)-like protein/PAS domain S-box-containing protein
MLRPGFPHLAFGATYFAIAAVPIALTRLDAGVAFLWVATALLTAKLRTTDRHSWGWWLGAAGIGSMLATGLFGLGWAAAPAMMVLNLLDAVIAAKVLSMAETRQSSVSVESNGPAIVAACLAGAIATMVPAGAVASLATGTPLISNAANWVIGHTLGSLTFGPFMFFCMRGRMAPWIKGMAAGRDIHSLGAVLVLVATSVLAFNQSSLSLLFLPVLALTALTYRAGLPGAAFGSVVLGIIGCGFTLAGHAGTEFGSPAATFQFFQFFLGVTTLTMLPVSAVISARKEMTERLQHSEAGYRLLADNIDDIVVSFDLKGRLTYVSPSFQNFAGRQPCEVIGSFALQMIDPSFYPRVRMAHAKMIAARGAPVTFEFVGITDGEQQRWFEMQGHCVIDAGGKPVSVIGTVRETTGRKMLETALASAAETDQLTGLLIRRAFFDAALVTVHSGSSGYLAIFDLDHLDAINTVIGNEAGDLVLSTFAGVGRRIVRERDLFGRLEDDAFALLLPNTTCEQAESVCRRLLAAFASERLTYQGRPIAVTASAGLARLEGNLDEALRTARSALVLAKNGGRACLKLAA